MKTVLILASQAQNQLLVNTLESVLSRLNIVQIDIETHILLHDLVENYAPDVILMAWEGSLSQLKVKLTSKQNVVGRNTRLILIMEEVFDISFYDDLSALRVANVVTWRDVSSRLGGIILQEIEHLKQIPDWRRSTREIMALERSSERLSVLHGLDRAILQSDSLETIAQSALRNINKLMPCRRTSVLMIDSSSLTAHILAVRDEEKEVLMQVELDFQISPIELEALNEHPYLIINDLNAYPTVAMSQLYEEGIRTILSIGLKQAGKLIGALNLHATTEKFFVQEYIDIGLEVADQLAIGIYTAQLKEQIQSYAEDLEERVNQRTLELQREKTHINAILNSTADGILLIDEYFTIKQMNQTSCKLFGQNSEWLFGRNLLHLIHTDDRKRFQQSLKHALNEGVVLRLEVRGLCQRDFFYGDIGVARMDGIEDDTDHLVCSVRDITRHKLTEERLKEREKRLRSFIESQSAYVARTDLQGNYTYHNQSFYDKYGWLDDTGSLVGKSILDTVIADDHAKAIEAGAACISEPNKPLRVSLRKQGRDGVVLHTLWEFLAIADDDGNVTEIQCMGFDITAQKEAEEALRASEVRYRSLFEQSNDAVFILDGYGVHLYVNRRAAEMLGYEPHELKNLSFRDIISDEDHHKSEHILERLRAGERVPLYEREFRRKDGSRFPVEINVETVRDEDGNVLHIQSIVRDITDRKAIENALIESEERYRTTVSSMSEGVILQDVDGNVDFVNDAAQAITGLTLSQYRREAPVPDYWQAIHENGSPVKDEDYPASHVLKTGKPMSNVVIGIKRTLDETAWILSSAQPIQDADGRATYGVVTTFVDITDMKRVEAELLSTSRRLQLATQSAGIGIWEFDVTHDNLIWDSQTYDLFDLTPANFSHNKAGFEKMVHPVDRKRVALALELALKGEHDYQIDFKIVLLNGIVRHLYSKAIVVRNAEGEAQSLIGVNYDITAQKQYEQILQRALEQQKELSELKSRFVTMASHEFRTPLATILATVETLLAYRHRMDDAQIDVRLDKIAKQVGYMKTIMDDVLQLSRIQAGKNDFRPYEHDFNILCLEIIEEFNSHEGYAERIAYKAELETNLIVFDERLMRYVVSNLVSNALKYSEDVVELALTESVRNIIIRVSDKGIGIPEADLNHLFEPFHRAQNVGTISGTGLGLSITKESVALHNGRIEVQSTLGVGTTFIVTLPKTNEGVNGRWLKY